MTTRVLRLAGILIATMVVCGCMQVTTIVTVRNDGSGTVIETAYMGEAIEKMMQEMMAGMAGAGGKGGKVKITEQPIDIEQCKAKAAKMGEGVAFVSAEKVKKRGARGQRVVYSFDDITKLRLSSEIEKPAAAGARGQTSKKEVPITFRFVKGDPAKLIVNIPQDSAEKETAGMEAFQANAQAPKPGEIAQMKQMFGDFRFLLAVKVDGDIMETNASFVGVDESDGKKNLVTLIDMNLGELVKSEEQLKKLATMGPAQNMAAAKGMLKGFPGIKVETSKRVEIEFARVAAARSKVVDVDEEPRRVDRRKRDKPVVRRAAAIARAPATAGEAAIRQHFRTAVDCLETGDYEECEKALNKVLELEPTSSLALELREEAGYRFFIKLLARKPLDVLAREFLALAEKRTLERKTDPDYILGLIKDLKGDFETRWYAKMRLEAEVGQYAVPYLVDLIRDGANELSTFCRIVLRGIGEEGVPALLACLDSGDIELIEAVVLVLGQIGDDRAIPDLAVIHQGRETKSELRMLAGQSLKKITGGDAGELGPARELLFDRAEKHYYRHPSIMRERRVTGYILWKWSEAKNGLVWQEAPPSVYYGELAELACYDCFAIAPDYEPPYALLAAIYFSQLESATRVIAAADAGDNRHADIIQRNIDYLKLRQMDLQRKTNLVAKSLGAVHLYRCLNRALKDGDVAVSTMAMRKLGEVADGTLLPVLNADEKLPEELPDEGNVGGAEGTPILRALASPDKRIRYVAAETLVAMNPPKAFLHCERVVPALGQALGEKAVWFVMMVDADSQRTNRFSRLFTSDEFTMLAVPSPAYARERATEFPAPDLILIATDLPDRGAEKLVSQFKIDFRTAGIPMFVLTTPETRVADENVFADKVEEIVVLKEGLLGAIAEIRNRFKKRSVENVKSESETVALRAARSIALIDPRSTHLTPFDALDILIRSASERSDEIKRPCITALGQLGSGEAASVLTSLFENKGNDIKIRLLAGESHGLCSPKTAYGVLKDALNEEEEDIRQWAATALGKAGLHGEELKKVLLEQRVGPVLEETGATTGG